MIQTEQEVAPLPTAELPSAQAIASDNLAASDLASSLVEAGVIDPFQREGAAECLLEGLSRCRSSETERLMSGYLAVSLFASNLVSLIRTVKDASHPHPHGNEPRVLVFANEFNALVEACPSAFIQPAIEESMRISAEVRSMQRARKEADSARSALVRIAADLTRAVEAPELTRTMEISNTALAMRDLAQTELKAKNDPLQSAPTDAELAASYYPVTLATPDSVRLGDVLFEPKHSQVLYQHGGPREAVSLEVGAANVVEQLKKGGVVIMRPFGSQAVLALRMRSVQGWLKNLAAMEKQYAKSKGKKGSVHLGRTEGLSLACEMLTSPSWALPAVTVDASVVKSDEKRS